MKKKGYVFKILSYILAVISAILLFLAVSVAVGGGNGFLDLSNFVAIIILGAAFVFSVLAAVMSYIYKLQRKKADPFQ